jgi:predicted O-methyltransferase YrrM
MLKDYLKYLFNSHNLHGVHSPFVYELNEKVMNARPDPGILSKIEKYRPFLKSSETKLNIEDLGGGSRKMKTSERLVKDIYKNASSNRRMGEILYQLIRHYQCRNIIEIGTSLGVGTSYMQTAIGEFEKAKIISIEGSHELYKFTELNFKNYFENSKVEFLEGNFDKVLPALLSGMETFDLALVDGNHTYEATLHYFNLLLEETHNDSIIIFDDIYWSEGMKKAWKEIQQNPKVTCSIDIFRWGLVFFRREMKKEGFILRFNGFLKAHIS